MAGTLKLTSSVAYVPEFASGSTTLKIIKNLGFTGVIGGEYTIPVGTTNGTLLDIPSGLLETVDGFVIRNDSDQELTVYINEIGPLNNLVPGAVMFMQNPSTSDPVSLPITSLALMTSETQSTLVNKISYFVAERTASP